jgi:hypothetical protein
MALLLKVCLSPTLQPGAGGKAAASLVGVRVRVPTGRYYRIAGNS